jgi:hypothetical protein
MTRRRKLPDWSLVLAVSAGITVACRGQAPSARAHPQGEQRVAPRHVDAGAHAHARDRDDSTGGAANRAVGSIMGLVRDGDTSKPIAGVTVVAFPVAADEPKTAIADHDGVYRFAELPAGDYTVTFFYGWIVQERQGVVVVPGEITPACVRLFESFDAGDGDAGMLECSCDAEGCSTR